MEGERPREPFIFGSRENIGSIPARPEASPYPIICALNGRMPVPNDLGFPLDPLPEITKDAHVAQATF